MKRVNATEFKAHCLSILDDVAEDGDTVVVTKRGKPVARIVTASGGEERPPQHTLEGTVEIAGDIVAPALPAEAWKAHRGRR